MTLNFILKKLGHETTLCADGLEAWAALQKERFDVVFADWVMPGIDGLELCRRIRQADHEHYVYVVLCTAKDTQADLLIAMTAGADDFSVKPVRPDEIEVRVRAAQRICDLQSKLKAQNQELEEEHQKLSDAYLRIENDLAAAAKVLEDLLPKSHSDPRLRTSYFFQPSHLLGGDFLNYFPLGEDVFGFYLLDVAGHGIPASLKASSLSRILSPNDSLLWRDQDRREPQPPHEVAKRLNRLFLDEDDYFTLIYGLFHTKERYLEFTQAGHPAPVLVRNGRSQTVGQGGYPISLIDTDDFTLETLELERGDRLFFYSDGLTEAESSSEEQFGSDKLLYLLAEGATQSLQQTVERVQKEVEDFRLGEPQDDISLLGIEIG